MTLDILKQNPIHRYRNDSTVWIVFLVFAYVEEQIRFITARRAENWMVKDMNDEFDETILDDEENSRSDLGDRATCFSGRAKTKENKKRSP